MADPQPDATGAYSPALLANQHVKDIAEKIRKQINEIFPMFQAVMYSSQVVTGMNYVIRVVVTDKVIALNSLDCQVYESLSGDLTVNKTKKTRLDASLDPLK